jgi:hypothetical protein
MFCKKIFTAKLAQKNGFGNKLIDIVHYLERLFNVNISVL